MFNNIASIIPRSIKRAGISREIAKADVFKVFNDAAANILDNDELSKIKPVFSRGEELIVASLDDQVTGKIRENEQKLQKIMNNSLGQEQVKRIRVLT